MGGRYNGNLNYDNKKLHFKFWNKIFLYKQDELFKKIE